MLQAQTGQNAQLDAEGHSQDQEATGRHKSLGMRHNGKGLLHHHNNGNYPIPSHAERTCLRRGWRHQKKRLKIAFRFEIWE